MKVIQKNKLKNGTTEYVFDNGVQAKPKVQPNFSTPTPVKLNPNLKLRAPTQRETDFQENMAKYQTNGKSTIMGTARLMGDVVKKVVTNLIRPDSYKKGGKVKKTGLALVHKGELVLNKKQQSKLRKKLKKK
ncbi:MAG: hypothetical protein WCQ47_07515 [bacterium]